MLLFVSKNASMEEVIRLIQEGADVNAVDNLGKTPLLLAARSNSNSDVLRVLIDNGADVAFKDKEGKNALDYADENEGLKGTDAYNLLRKKRFPGSNFSKGCLVKFLICMAFFDKCAKTMSVQSRDGMDPTSVSNFATFSAT